ncbi:MAG: hypothetical protein ACRDPT_02865 [Streptomycetales bacterium]
MVPGNPLLAVVLEELGWSLTRLAAETNAVMGAGYVSRSTVSEWVNRGRVPHEPMPTVVAHLLSDALDEPVSLDKLWQGRARSASLWVPSDDGLDLTWNLDGTVAVLHDWLTHGGGLMDLDRRTFLAISGAALTGPAWDYVDTAAGRDALARLGAGGGEGVAITPGMVDVIDATVANLRALDDQEGGDGDNLRFVHRHFRTVAGYLKSGNFSEPQVGVRLLASWAQLAQLAGWMAHDAEEHGLAQRYYRTGLHAAHTARDRDVGAYILGSMSYHAIARGRLRDAIELANAAAEAAQRASPAVRALTASRYAYAQAAIGNLRAFREGTDEARGLLDRPGALERRPSWLYWFDSLDVITGQSLIAAAYASSRNPRPLLEEAETLLNPWLDSGAERTEPREVLFHGSWLARSFVRRGELDRALDTGRRTLRNTRSVRSRSSMFLLRQLDEDLAGQRGVRYSAEVAAFRDELRAAFAA